MLLLVSMMTLGFLSTSCKFTKFSLTIGSCEHCDENVFLELGNLSVSVITVCWSSDSFSVYSDLVGDFEYSSKALGVDVCFWKFNR